MNTCTAHAYRRAACADCNEVNPPKYDPATNLVARAYRETYRTPPSDDLPDPRDILTDGVDSEGMVTRVRWISWTEHLAMLDRESRGDVS